MPRQRIFRRMVDPGGTSGGGTGGGTGGSTVLTRAQREALTIGTYKPDANNTGLLPNVPLTPVTPAGGVLTTSSTGQIIENLEVLGTIKINHANVILRNLWVRGRLGLTTGTATSMIDCRFGANGNTLIEDVLVDPRDTLNWAQDGIRERGFTCRRVRVRGIIDHFDPNPAGATTDPTRSINVFIYGSWMDVCAKNCPDSGHTDGTHNDCIQFVGGAHSVVRGNRIDNRLDPSMGNTGGRGIQSFGVVGDPTCAERTANGVCTVGNACLQFNQNLALTDCLIENNWFDGGTNTINGGALTTQYAHQITIRNNVFAHRTPGPTGLADGVQGQYLPESGSGSIPIINMSASAVPNATITGNVFDTGGAVPGNRG